MQITLKYFYSIVVNVNLRQLNQIRQMITKIISDCDGKAFFGFRNPSMRNIALLLTVPFWMKDCAEIFPECQINSYPSHFKYKNQRGCTSSHSQNDEHGGYLDDRQRPCVSPLTFLRCTFVRLTKLLFKIMQDSCFRHQLYST